MSDARNKRMNSLTFHVPGGLYMVDEGTLPKTRSLTSRGFERLRDRGERGPRRGLLARIFG